MITYWFSREDGTTKHQKTPVQIGVTQSCSGKLIPCDNGLHSSPTPFDALQYAQGPILWKVRIGKECVPHGNPIDKFASRTRTPICRIDASGCLRTFAAKQALTVVGLWSPPAIVLQYLNDESNGIDRSDIRAAAQDAARAAAWTAARAAAWAAARTAALAAARAATLAAAQDAAKKLFNSMCAEEFKKRARQ